MSEEISKGSLSVLMIMTLLISVLSTLTVINAIDGAKTAPAAQEKGMENIQAGNFAGLRMELVEDEQISEQANVRLTIKR